MTTRMRNSGGEDIWEEDEPRAKFEKKEDPTNGLLLLQSQYSSTSDDEESEIIPHRSPVVDRELNYQLRLGGTNRRWWDELSPVMDSELTEDQDTHMRTPSPCRSTRSTGAWSCSSTAVHSPGNWSDEESGDDRNSDEDETHDERSSDEGDSDDDTENVVDLASVSGVEKLTTARNEGRLLTFQLDSPDWVKATFYHWLDAWMVERTVERTRAQNRVEASIEVLEARIELQRARTEVERTRAHDRVEVARILMMDVQDPRSEFLRARVDFFWARWEDERAMANNRMQDAMAMFRNEFARDRARMRNAIARDALDRIASEANMVEVVGRGSVEDFRKALVMMIVINWWTTHDQDKEGLNLKKFAIKPKANEKQEAIPAKNYGNSITVTWQYLF